MSWLRREGRFVMVQSYQTTEPFNLSLVETNDKKPEIRLLYIQKASKIHLRTPSSSISEEFQFDLLSGSEETYWAKWLNLVEHSKKTLHISLWLILVVKVDFRLQLREILGISSKSSPAIGVSFMSNIPQKTVVMRQKHDIYIYTWNLFVLYFGGWTLQNKVLSQSKQGSSGF